jgi:hypothetical protein
MADPLLYNTPVEVEMSESLKTLRGLLSDIPDAATPYSEAFDNPYLLSSPLDLLDVAEADSNVRDVHGTAVIAAALTRVIAAQQERIEKLEAKVRTRSKARA